MVPAPLTGQSACAQIEWGEYGFYHDYFYLDGSPTFGAENDTAGAFGSLRGTVTDSSSGWPIQGALIEASRGVSAVTDSSGVYSMELLSGYQSVTASATGYRTDTSDLNEIAVLVDSTLIYDIDMSIASGLRRRGETTQSMPRAFSLSQNYPNPFNPSTSIGYQVSDRSHLAIRIFDLRGRLVRTLVEGVFEPGGYSVEWNGGDSSGRQVPSGIYIYRMEKDGDQVSAKKMVILK